MKYIEAEVGKAKGRVLLNDIRTDLGVLYKGHVVADEDVVILKAMGIKKLFVVEVEEGDIEQATVRDMVAAKICGKNTAYAVGQDGVVKIVATESGFLVSDENRIKKFNDFNEDIKLNAVYLYKYVEAGDVVAKLELCVPVFAAEDIENIILGLSGNVELISVYEPKDKRVAVVFSEVYKDKREKRHFADSLAKLGKVLQGLGVKEFFEYRADHNEQSVGDKIEDAMADKSDAIFIVSGLQTQGQNDVVPLAVKSLTGNILKQGMSKVGMCDFMIAEHRKKRIINLPYRFADGVSELLDEMIVKAVISDKLSAVDFDFCDEVLPVKEKLGADEKIIKSKKKDGKKNDVAVIVLAAGVSSRAGRNKLMVDLKGEQLFMKAVKEAIKSGLGPVYVVIGYMGSDIEKALRGYDVNIVKNPAFRDGVQGSVRIGLNHVPSFCDGAILMAADMPNITAAHLQKMAKKLDRRKNKQVVITSYKRVKHNPILWSRGLFEEAEIVPDTSSLRPSLVEFEDYTELVDVKVEKEVWDINYPIDIEKIVKGK